MCLLCERMTLRNVLQQRAISQFPRIAASKASLSSVQSAPQPQYQLTFKRPSTAAALKSGVRRPNDHARPPQAAKEKAPERRPQNFIPRVSAQESAAALERAKELGSGILEYKYESPSEEAVLEAMKACEIAARQLTGYDESPDGKSTTTKGSTPASALLSLDARPTHHVSLAISIDLLSSLAQKLMLHPTVFITPPILQSYVATQSFLQRPQSFPDIFRLYASKPAPKPSTTPLQFVEADPNSHKAAIPTDTANLALASAIRIKDLDLALAIINTTFRTRAFRRRKYITRALPPLTGLSLVPAALYLFASRIAATSTVVAQQDMTLMIFAGGLTYVGVVTSMGFIALSTSNDQMVRVTWQQGTPLRERWVREEERAAMDTVAQAWGFKETWKRGLEEGEEWEYLREWVGERGCIVDKVELMEGME